MESNGWAAMAARLTGALGLTTPPVAISFCSEPPAGVELFDEPMSPAAADGRSGRVPASCVFWMRAATRTFATVAEDHGNCSVGRVVHGFASLTDVAGNDDVAALLGSGWVDEAAVSGIPALSASPGAIVYGPLADAPVDPDVVLLRLDGHQLMILTDALPGLRLQGKPQCRIVPDAAEGGEVAVSVGCALSRARTGMGAEEMTCAIPAGRLAEVVERLQAVSAIDSQVARYALEDARRF